MSKISSFAIMAIKCWHDWPSHVESVFFSVGKDTQLRVKNKTMSCFSLADLMASMNIIKKNLNSRGETYIVRLAKCYNPISVLTLTIYPLSSPSLPFSSFISIPSKARPPVAFHPSSLKDICFGLQKTVFYPPKDRLSPPESLSFAGWNIYVSEAKSEKW